MEYRFEIPGTLPTFNEFDGRSRTNRFSAASLKRKTQDYMIAHAAGLFTWILLIAIIDLLPILKSKII